MKYVLLSLSKEIRIEAVSNNQHDIRQALFNCKAKEKRYFKASGLLHLELESWLKPLGEEHLIPTILNLLELKWTNYGSFG
jgi:hypothetical protein